MDPSYQLLLYIERARHLAPLSPRDRQEYRPLEARHVEILQHSTSQSRSSTVRRRAHEVSFSLSEVHMVGTFLTFLVEWYRALHAPYSI